MNRLINGSGVVTGLAVAPAAGGTQLVVQAGVAIDGWGREIVVPSLSVPFDPRIVTGDDGRPSGTVSGSGSVAISICYQECGIDPTPNVAASCSSGDGAPGITREKYSVRVQAGTAVSRPVTCGFGDDVSGIYAALASRINQPYVDPSGQGCVLLAQVNLPASGALTDSMVDNTVRPVVVNTGLLLELVFSLAQRVQQLAAGSTRG
jgi:hypothetical protein